MKNKSLLWLLFGATGACLLPWYALEDGFWAFTWIRSLSDPEYPSALVLILEQSHWWLMPPLVALVAGFIAIMLPMGRKGLSRMLIAVSLLGSFFVIVQGFAIGLNEPKIFLSLLEGSSAANGQPGLGVGAIMLIASFLYLLTIGIAGLKKGTADIFIIGLIGTIITLVGVFVFFPIAHVLITAFETADGGYGASRFFSRYFSGEVWGLNCLVGDGVCGPAINSVFLATMTGVGTTLLGLTFALIATRTRFRAKRLLRILTVLPIITPPFVIGLALILLFGRAGVVTEWSYALFDIEKSRWLYGFTGVYLSQLLSFTPIAFLVMIGVVEGVSPSMEEASQTMRATQWQTFTQVSLPLMRPGLANAFLLGFIESLADFGNPLVLGGDFSVLSTEIYFAIVGAVADTSRAAVLGMVLLTLTITAFLFQRWWLGKKSYATVTGKADSGQNSGLNSGLKWACYLVAIPWAVFTAIVYCMIVYGSFVKLWGYDNSFTLEHYISTFGVKTEGGLRFVGSAWDSYITTLQIASIAAPLTALLGLLTAYVLVRQRFAGKDLFEFSTMLSFAIPGTVVGISYILAFNVPPIELTGTGIILIIAFMFRNMPVGVRGGIAAMSQLDKSLDEASITLGANSFTTLRRVIAPLLGPAILAALIYSFVRAITSVSAVIFLVSAKHNMATSFIVGRVENGEFGIAIAYSTVLIITMLAAILLLQLIVGKRKLRKDTRVQNTENKTRLVQANI